ncbi:MAG: beta-ketoacyl synthase N-terminal-like domain-containing protein [Luteolibacter sp.]
MPSAPRLLPEGINSPISIVGLGALSSLGHDIDAHFVAISEGKTGLKPMADLLGKESRHADLHGGWIEPRELLNHRKWSPASMAALHVAREAISQTGWTAEEMADTALIIGTSRGNAAGWLSPWPGRRPFKLMAASNTIHSEPATAISIELGILGQNHVVASGCSAGLDALGLGKMILDGGLAKRALVVAVDLPLVPMLLDQYADSGLLSKSSRLDPFSPATSGFIPGEGAAAIAISKEETNILRFDHFSNNSDGADPVGVPKDGGRSYLLLENAIRECGLPTAICPHSTGTKIQARAENAILRKSFDAAPPDLHLLKPYVGHSIGASGLLESAVLLRFMKEGMLPPNLPGTTPPDGWTCPAKATSCKGAVFKLAHGMGGHNALAAFSIPS